MKVRSNLSRNSSESLSSLDSASSPTTAFIAAGGVGLIRAGREEGGGVVLTGIATDGVFGV